jgi:hypothetical protein
MTVYLRVVGLLAKYGLLEVALQGDSYRYLDLLMEMFICNYLFNLYAIRNYLKPMLGGLKDFGWSN